MNPTVEDVIHGWVVRGSGLQDVIWARQEGPRPSTTWISLTVIDDSSVGRDYFGLREDTPGTVDEVVYSNSTFTLSIQCFNGSATGNSSPEQVLKNVRLQYSLPSERLFFQQAKIAVLTWTPIQTVGGVINSSRFEPRAILEATFATADEKRLPITDYIESVDIEQI